MKAQAAVIFVVLLTGCATDPDDIAPSYVSPLSYQNYDCSQLREEAQRVSRSAAIAAGQQEKERNSDAVKTGVGLVVFWPTLLFLEGDGPKATEVARLKGEMDAIQQASIQKKCQIEFKTQ